MGHELLLTAWEGMRSGRAIEDFWQRRAQRARPTLDAMIVDCRRLS